VSHRRPVFMDPRRSTTKQVAGVMVSPLESLSVVASHETFRLRDRLAPQATLSALYALPFGSFLIYRTAQNSSLPGHMAALSSGCSSAYRETCRARRKQRKQEGVAVIIEKSTNVCWRGERFTSGALVHVTVETVGRKCLYSKR
jgi:hypothetical protein